MIDTLRIAINAFSLSAKPELLKGQLIRYPSGYVQLREVLAPPSDGQYHPQVTIDGGVSAKRLCVQFSAPKLLWGTSLFELGITHGELELMVRCLMQELEGMGVRVTREAILDARLMRLDISRNFLVPGSAYDFVEKMGKISCPPRLQTERTVYSSGDQVAWQSSNQRISFYDKGSELAQDVFAQDSYEKFKSLFPTEALVRLEIQLLNKTAIARTLKLKKDIPDVSLSEIWDLELMREVLRAKYDALFMDGLAAITLLAALDERAIPSDIPPTLRFALEMMSQSSSDMNQNIKLMRKALPKTSFYRARAVLKKMGKKAPSQLLLNDLRDQILYSPLIQKS